MLALPQFGVARSVNEHNCDLHGLADWIEGSVLFHQEVFSSPDAVDILLENSVYESQEFAWEFVLSVWGEIRRRRGLLGKGYPIDLVDKRLVPKRKWREVPALSFCLALSFVKWYPNWASSLPKALKAHVEQGRLLECISAEALKAELADWQVHMIGWSRTKTGRLEQRANEIADLLGERIGNVKLWTPAKAKDAGLDVLCFRPFPDGRGGIPVYLVQCASGMDWDTKLHTPELKIWTKIIDFSATPTKAFAMPFTLPEDEFLIACNRVDGLFLDRYRLLSPARRSYDWLSKPLGSELVKWLKPRVKELPTADDA